MNYENILSEIEKVNPEVYEKKSERRNILKDLSYGGKRIALAALPLALGAIFNKSYATPTATDVVGVFNFALTLEYIEAGFYNQGVAASGLIPSTDIAGLQIIQAHENEHVALLQQAITSVGSQYVAAPTVDYTAGGLFPDVFTNYQTFLEVSQTFEDTGVRAYKGQAPNLQGFTTLILGSPALNTALQIHSVEARHASYIRQLRGVRPWITEATSDISGTAGTAVAGNYAGEDLTTQLGVNIVGIGGNAGITADEASQAFDEPLTQAQVLALLAPFLG